MTQVKVKNAGNIRYVLMSWDDKNTIIGRLKGIVDAAMPEGKQCDALKDLIGSNVQEYFGNAFSTQRAVMNGDGDERTFNYDKLPYIDAFKEVYVLEEKSKAGSIPVSE